MTVKIGFKRIKNRLSIICQTKLTHYLMNTRGGNQHMNKFKTEYDDISQNLINVYIKMRIN